MTSLRELYGKEKPGGSTSNFGVDYVIQYNVPAKERPQSEAAFVQLITTLTSVGLASEVRQGQPGTLLVFLKIASPSLLENQVYRSRLQDWLQGVRTSSSGKGISESLQDEPVTEAERLRLVYLLLIKPRNEGGAGITPATGQWKYVQSIFPLHDHEFNRNWIHGWSKKYLLDEKDLDQIRDKFGESVAFYFAFVQSYFRALIFPSAFGFACWMLLGQFSFVYALGSCLWSVVFFEYWKQKEVDLAVTWGVRGVSSIQLARPEFVWDYEAEDPVTGEPVKVYPPSKRLSTQLLQIPFALACVVALGGLVVTCNSLEIFINEVYNGPGKQYLGFLPTILLVVFTPTFSAVLMSAAEKLTNAENYENVDAHHAALIQKQFVLNFMTSYMALFFTAFVYIPFGYILTPFLGLWHQVAQTVSFSEKPIATHQFEINPARISNQMFYFTVTAQIVNFATEVVVPYVKQQVFAQFKELQHKGTAYVEDHPEEKEFLKRVREECELEVYDVSGDYREMVMQYGYLSLFSVAWPLASACFQINNWVELRSDALKIAISSRRPIPWRSDSIGPWLTTLGFLSWLGSITSSAIVFLCSGTQDGERGTTAHITAWGTLLSIVLSEHFFLAVQLGVRFVMNKYESPGLQRERKERYLMKKQLLEETLGQEVSNKSAATGVEKSDKITREALEEEARQASVKGQGTAADTFWQRQRGMQETIYMGQKMIAQQAAQDGSKKAPTPSPKA